MLTLFFVLKWKTEHYAHKPFLQDFLHKSISPFQNWTKKMSKIENPFYFSAKSYAYTENFHFYVSF